MSVIQNLWYGRIDPMEANAMLTPEIRALNREVADLRRALEETLTPEQMEMLDQYTECRSKQETVINAKIFESGFKLSGQLMAEILLSDPREMCPSFARQVMNGEDEG